MINRKRFQADEIFSDALNLPPQQRPGFLQAACADDTALHGEVASLLCAHECAAGFLTTATRRLGDENPQEPSGSGWIGRMVGPYRITEAVGCGGMGTVWRATRADHTFDRQVAIKIIRGDIAVPALMECFFRERQALSTLQHPNITALLDAGVTDDHLPYLVMEYVDGRPIDRYCDEQKFDLRARLELFLTVCEAVQHAHRHLIVHRDLKPAHLLVTADGTPKLLDFGIAKIIEQGGLHHGPARTVTALRIMTPQYASPEQLRGEAVTIASDVFSLGAVLYELLCGRPACPAEGPTMLQSAPPSQALGHPVQGSCRQDAQSEADIAAARGVSVDRLRRRLRGDLDNIVLMALRTDPTRRYASVAQFADDLRACLSDRPVMARRESIGYVTGKLLRRHKLPCALAAAAALFLVAGTIGIYLALLDARRARSAAEEQKSIALAAMHRSESVSDFLGQALAAANPFRHNGDLAAVDVLKEASRRLEQGGVTRPDVKTEIHMRLGRAYADLWLWKEVLFHATQATDLCRKLYPGSIEYAKCLVLKGRAQTFARLPQSVDTQREALAIFQAKLPPDHPTTAHCKVAVAFALWHGISPAQPDEAEKWAVEGVETLRRGELTHDRAVCTMSLGIFMMTQGRKAEAESLLHEAVSVFEQLPYNADQYYVVCLDRYSMVLHELGKFDEAERYVRKSLALTPEGMISSTTSDALWRLGTIRHHRRDFAEAAQCYRRSLSERLRKLAEDDESAREICEAHQPALAAGLQDSTGKLYQPLLAALADFDRAEHVLWQDRLQHLARCCRRIGRTTEAQAILQAVNSTPPRKN
jgi:serine/threonine-protein kinase